MDTIKKAENVRDVIRYLQKFKNALLVIYLDDKTIESPLFSSHIRDIALLHEAGFKVVIIPGARSRIDQVLTTNKIEWTYKGNVRVSTPDAMPLIKMAAFDVSNTVMTSLAANGITAVIGNWVRSRAKGVIDGFDYGTAGEIDRLDEESLCTVLSDGFIPIFPCIGWSSVGHPYNISSLELAQQVAIQLKADKLFFVMENGSIKKDELSFGEEEIPIGESGNIAALNLVQLAELVDINKDRFSLPEEQQKKIESIRTLLQMSYEACLNGVTRVHLVNGIEDGVLLSEMFSDFGSGTMVYKSDYGYIRNMERSDIPAVLELMRPFVQSGKLLPRTEEELSKRFVDYLVYELDGGIHGCASVEYYEEENQTEIAAVAVDENYSHMGIGPNLVECLISLSHQHQVNNIFIMTTQAADWFEKLGFVEDTLDSIPAKRREKWTPERNSKVYRLKD